MKIKKDVLKNFLQKVHMQADQQINECVLNFDKEGLKVGANSPSQQARAMGWLKTNGFKEYEEFGELGINDMSTLIKVIDRFGEILTLKHEGNVLTVNSEGKKVDVELVDTSFITTDTKEPNLQFEDVFVIHSKKVSEIFKDASLNKDTIITVETVEKKVKFSNTGKYKFVHTLDAETCKGGVKVSYGQPLIDAISNLDGNLEMSVKKDYPAKVLEKTENSVITIIVAPRVENESE